MATRYWVGGAGTWDSSSTTNWSATSGGASGSSAPTSADDAIFDSLGGTGTVTIVTGATCRILTWNSTTLTMGGSDNFTIYRTFGIETGVTITYSGFMSVSYGAGTSFYSGTTLPFSVVFVNTGSASWSITTYNFTCTGSLTLQAGTLDIDGFTLTVGRFSSSNPNTRTIAFGTGSITCTESSLFVWNTSTVTGLTVTGTPVVNITSTGSGALNVSTGALSEANSISFNFTGGTYALTFLDTAGATAKNVNFTGFAGTLTATSTATIYGNLTLSSGMTLTASTSATTFRATSGTKTITTNGKTIDFPLTFNGAGGTFELQDALTMGSTRTATLTNGTLNLNGFTYTVGTSFTTAAGTKNLTFNGGTLVCPDPNTSSFNNASPTNFTTTAGTGTGVISMTAATAKRFVGGGSTFNCTLNQGGAGALTVTGSNTFSNITNTVQPASVLFTAGTTSTFTNFNLSGTAGNLITIGSVTAASHTLSKASGTVNANYLSISRSTATGGAIWNARNSTDGGNNTGWIFNSGTGRFFQLF